MKHITSFRWIDNPDYKWWNFQPKFIKEEYPVKVKIDADGYLMFEEV